MPDENVTAAADTWLAEFRLPAAVPGEKDLAGQSIPIGKIRDEESCRYFFPRRTLLFQQRMTKAITVTLRKRGAKITSIPLDIETYARWLETAAQPDSPALRYQFATRPPC